MSTKVVNAVDGIEDARRSAHDSCRARSPILNAKFLTFYAAEELFSGEKPMWDLRSALFSHIDLRLHLRSSARYQDAPRLSHTSE